MCKTLGLSGKDDPIVLEWAAQEGGILLTHGVTTITRYAYDRVKLSQTMTGVSEVNADASVGRVIEDILIFVECSDEGEIEDQIQYLSWVVKPNENKRLNRK